MEILVRGKDAEQNAEQFRSCLDIIKKAGNKVGVLTKDPATGPFVDEWKAAFGEIEKDVDQVDMSLALSAAALLVKDEKELVSHSYSMRIDAVLNFLTSEQSVTPPEHQVPLWTSSSTRCPKSWTPRKG
jgi:nucleosome binding factor SPN SPT16 subunit